MRGLLIALPALLLLAPVLAEARTSRDLLGEGHVRIRVSTEPARQVVIGQQTRLFVEILTDTWFSKAPAYPELTLEGAIVLMPEQLGTNFTENIDGITFAAQRRSYVIFPERVGPLKIPSLRIRLGVSEDGKAGTPFWLSTPPQRLNVVLPAEAEGVDGLVTTPHLTVRDRFSKPLEDLKVGDAVKRTVEMDAERALGMLLPELAFVAPSGIAVYPDQPRIRDSVNRGQYRGERIESVTYLLQRPGEFTLPAIELHWWNPTRGTLESETLEEHSFEVSGAAGGTALASPSDLWASWRARLDQLFAYLREHRLALLLTILGAVVLGRVASRLLPELLAWRRTRQQRRRDSEAELFRELQRTVRRRDVDAVMRDFWRWRDRLIVEVPCLAPEALRHAAETSGFAQHWAEFERERYGGLARSPSPAGLGPLLRAFRAALLSTAGGQAMPSAPRLNPSASTSGRPSAGHSSTEGAAASNPRAA